MRQTKVSCSSQLHSEHQSIYTLWVKRNRMSKGLMNSSCIQSQGQAAVAETCLSIETYRRQFKPLTGYHQQATGHLK